MTKITLKINERTAVGRSFIAFIEAFSKKGEGVEIVKEESPYHPDFVAKIRKAEKQKSVKVNPKDIWGSLGLK